MSLVSDAKSVLQQADFTQIDHIYVGNIPEGYQDATDSTDVLITESGNSPADYGNNDFHTLEQSVEVAVFYSLDWHQDTDDFEVQLMRTFVHHGWSVAASRPHVIDPDTFQITKIFYFSRIKELEA